MQKKLTITIDEEVYDGLQKTIADQLATVSKSRLFQRAGILSQKDMGKIVEAIKVQLDIY